MDLRRIFVYTLTAPGSVELCIRATPNPDIANRFTPQSLHMHGDASAASERLQTSLSCVDYSMEGLQDRTDLNVVYNHDVTLFAVADERLEVNARQESYPHKLLADGSLQSMLEVAAILADSDTATSLDEDSSEFNLCHYKKIIVLWDNAPLSPRLKQLGCDISIVDI
ncbi:hypothetical protein C8R48DRAFT_760513 [Suillus tomentosus]|nr:hypothetical protein C8R48DRAFT_760513 [Suillus tomentosus]